MRRAQECGLGTGANVFLAKPALRDFDRLVAVLLDLRLGMVNITIAGFTPTARGRRYEALRPDLADLLPIAQRVLDESCLLREQWGSLESHTEAAWVRRARDGSWPAADTGYCTSAYRQLVCRPNLDLHTGTTGIYRRCHGNLRRDGAQAVLELALATAPCRRNSSTSQGLRPQSLTSPRSEGTPTARRSISTLAPSATGGLTGWTQFVTIGETASPRQGASATSPHVDSRRD